MSFAETSTMYKTPGNRGEFEAPLGSESSAYPDRRTRVDSFSAQGVNVDKSDLGPCRYAPRRNSAPVVC